MVVRRQSARSRGPVYLAATMHRFQGLLPAPGGRAGLVSVASKLMHTRDQTIEVDFERL